MTLLTSLQVTSVLSYVIAVVVPALDAVFPESANRASAAPAASSRACKAGLVP